MRKLRSYPKIFKFSLINVSIFSLFSLIPKFGKNFPLKPPNIWQFISEKGEKKSWISKILTYKCLNFLTFLSHTRSNSADTGEKRSKKWQNFAVLYGCPLSSWTPNFCFGARLKNEEPEIMALIAVFFLYDTIKTNINHWVIKLFAKSLMKCYC